MMKSIAPQFLVADLPAAIAWYTEKLGFEQRIAYQDFYASVVRDAAHIHLKSATDLAGAREHRASNGHVDALIEVADVQALYREADSNQATIVQALETQPWGTRDFMVRDPDGHIICFMQDG